MSRRWVGVAFALVVGCTEAAKPPATAAPTPSAAKTDDVDVLEKLHAFRSQMCGCASNDRACEQKVKRAIDDFEGSHGDARVPYRQIGRVEKVKKDIAVCAKRAREGDPMEAIARFKDEMCACGAGDKDCVMRVQKEMTDYAEAHRDMNDIRMTDDEMKRAQDIGMAMAKCVAAAMGATP